MEYRYDDGRNLTRVIDSEGGHADSVYDVRGLLLNSTDFKGNITRFGYDQYGNVTEVNYPVGNGLLRGAARFDYDSIAHSDMVKVTDADGNSTNYEYDAKRRLKVVHFPDGGKVEYFYDVSSNITMITDSRNRQIIRFEYDILIPYCQNNCYTDGIASPCFAGIAMTLCSDYNGKLVSTGCGRRFSLQEQRSVTIMMLLEISQRLQTPKALPLNTVITTTDG